MFYDISIDEILHIVIFIWLTQCPLKHFGVFRVAF